MTHRFRLATAVATAALTLPLAHIATADTHTLGAGDPIRMTTHNAETYQNHFVPQGMCSVALTGTINGEDTIVTAGHCLGDPGNQIDDSEEINLTNTVYVPDYAGEKQTGTATKVKNPEKTYQGSIADPLGFGMFNETDYGFATATDDTTLTTGVYSRDEAGGNVGTLTDITGIRDYQRLDDIQLGSSTTPTASIDNFGQPVCKDGARTGRTCGMQLARTNNAVFTYNTHMDQGDSGGLTWDPNTKEAIGINSMTATTAFSPYVGEIGRAQPLDSAIEDAYGVEDGKVNNDFTLATDTTPRDEYMTMNDTTGIITEYRNMVHNQQIDAAQQAIDDSIDATWNVPDSFNEQADNLLGGQSDLQQAACECGQTLDETYATYQQSAHDFGEVADTDPQAALEAVDNTLRNF